MEKGKSIIFYSWQSDLPNKTNRGFIEEALEKAVKSIRSDNTIEVELVIDRDTKDIPGSPDISKTILEKIACEDSCWGCLNHQPGCKTSDSEPKRRL